MEVCRQIKQIIQGVFQYSILLTNHQNVKGMTTEGRYGNL